MLIALFSVALGSLRPPSSGDIPLDDPICRSDKLQQQVHLVGGAPHETKVVWMTKDFGEENLYVRANGVTITYSPKTNSYCNAESPSRHENNCTGHMYMAPWCYYCSPLIHTVLLKDLKPDTIYHYGFSVNDDETLVNNHQTSTYSFKTPPAVGKPISFGVVGDLGQTKYSLQTATNINNTDVDVVLFTGDISYADGYGERWDSYGIMMEFLWSRQITSYTVGNHEVFQHTENGLSAMYRFPADHLMERSGSPNQFYYSYNAGLAHVIALNSYARPHSNSLQYKWLRRDLEKVDRAKTPWIVVFLHAPWYSSSRAHKNEAIDMRDSMESLFLAHSVNFALFGHVHAYERTKPIAYNKTDPCGVTYITVGDGGNREGLETHWLPSSWSAYRESSYGFAKLDLKDDDNAEWTWFRNNDKSSTPADKVHIRRHKCEKQTIIA